ncbi:MAG: FAD-dependent oxidoreductase [Kiritimatiellales bacterium]|jgi:hypothetical protein
MSTNSFSRRGFIKISAAAGFMVSLSPEFGFAVDTESAPRVFPDNPFDRIQPIRAPRRAVREVVDGFLWIDAEQFDSYGGWELDTFHTDLTAASGYLLANRLAGPVDDAVTCIRIPEAGRWNLWVRTRNWLPEYSPGQFQVLVDGQVCGKVLGAADSDRWIWESGGAFETAKLKVEIRLKDLTGHLSRVDAIILTRNDDYRPPVEKEAMLAERARLTGMSLVPVDQGRFDVVVVGGGPAGIPAALAAARNGCRVALIHDRPVLGGNASLELGVPLCGAAEHKTFTRETGILEDFRAEAALAPDGPGKKKSFTYAAEMLVANEKNIRLFLNANVCKVDMDSGAIRSAYACNTLTGERSVFHGDVFIDCTGDGWLGYYAGAEYRLGREARSEFNESLAPDTPTRVTMSGSLTNGSRKPGFFYYAVERKVPVEFVMPAWAVKIPNADVFDKKRVMPEGAGIGVGTWWIEYPGATDDLYGEEEARDYLYRITAGFWNLMKNDWEKKEKVANWELIDIPSTLAKRETRRLMGDYILNQNDVEAAVLFEDRVAYAGWTLDVHNPDGIFSKDPFTAYRTVPVNHIPFRCLYSKNVANLLMAGRDGSFSGLALGAVRVECTCATMGQAAGTAAALCKRFGELPRGIYQNHIRDLQQQLLKDDQYIVGIVNEDPNDLARCARVSATSSQDAESAPGNVINGIARPFAGKQNQWVSQPGLGAGQSVELEFDAPCAVNTVHCVFDTDLSQIWGWWWKPIPKLVKAYTLSCFDGTAWHQIDSVTGNRYRRRIHRFARRNVQKLRVTVLETYGDPSARIYEIRLYNEA